MSESIDDLKSNHAALLAQARKFQRELLEMRAELEAKRSERDRWRTLSEQGRPLTADLIKLLDQRDRTAILMRQEVDHQTSRAEAAEARCRKLEWAVESATGELGRAGFDRAQHIYTINRAKAHLDAALSATPQSAGEAKCHCDAEADLADRPGARCADCVCQQPAPKPPAAEGKFPCGCVKPAASVSELQHCVRCGEAKQTSKLRLVRLAGDAIGVWHGPVCIDEYSCKSASGEAAKPL